MRLFGGFKRPFGVHGLGFRVLGPGERGFAVFGFRVQGFWGFEGLGFRSLGLRVWGFGFSGLGFRVSVSVRAQVGVSMVTTRGNYCEQAYGKTKRSSSLGSDTARPRCRT